MGRIAGLVGCVANRGIHEGGPGDFVRYGDAVSFVDVSKNVIVRSQRPEAGEQLKTARVSGRISLPRLGEIPMSIGRSVGDQYVGGLRNLAPSRRDVAPSIFHEMPIEEGWSVGRAEKRESVDLGCFAN